MWDELISDENFQISLRIFYLMQEWGAKQDGQLNNKTFGISDILSEDPRWTQLGSGTHTKVGQFIAHNFSSLAAMCTIPVCVVLDAAKTAEKGGVGTYKLTVY